MNKEEFITYLESIGFEKKLFEDSKNNNGIDIDFIHVYKDFFEVGIYELFKNNSFKFEVLIYYGVNKDFIWLTFTDAVIFINDKLKYELRKKKLNKLINK